jgi:hypothetical protein
MLPESVASMICPPPVEQYQPCYYLPNKEDIRRIQQLESVLKRYFIQFILNLGPYNNNNLFFLLSSFFFLFLLSKNIRNQHVSSTGASRTDGWEPNSKETGTKVTRILAKTVSGDDDEEDSNQLNSNVNDSNTNAESAEDRQINDDLYTEESIENQRLIEATRFKYIEMAIAYLEDNHNLQVRRSKIHGYGLFARRCFFLSFFLFFFFYFFIFFFFPSNIPIYTQ